MFFFFGAWAGVGGVNTAFLIEKQQKVRDFPLLRREKNEKDGGGNRRSLFSGGPLAQLLMDAEKR